MSGSKNLHGIFFFYLSLPAYHPVTHGRNLLKLQKIVGKCRCLITFESIVPEKGANFQQHPQHKGANTTGRLPYNRDTGVRNMMQGASVSSLAASGNGGNCGATAIWSRGSKFPNKTSMNSWAGGLPLWPPCALKLFITRSHGCKRSRFSIKAAWLFNQSDRGVDANSERSESANEDILIFFFQLDLQTRIQCALNMEQYDAAQQLRNKLSEVETEIIKQREAKRGSSSKSEAQDKAINLLRLRADLQKAIECENYTLAADLRDKISNIEAESLAASAKALAYENVEYMFRLGQKVKHKIFGYQAAVCGMDPVCCETSSWMETAQVDKLLKGPNQPFYQVLVDVHADPNLLVAYVAEENLLAGEELDMERFDHPYVSFLFYGVDSAGDFIPIKPLREKYNRPRHEVTVDANNDLDGEGDT
ncbi:hypothetical protein Taro_033119 [Colocasia esculenta]|uniref:Hemimethylated DNA-binding domain-containing protein n=1 Tax=Colocasia esculenta TaxID=4460 RepID=A0A843VUG4_COLES|nr:hypothetical protein [Colocasia esculenta]